MPAHAPIVYTATMHLKAATAVEIALYLNQKDPLATTKVTKKEVNQVLYREPELFTQVARDGLRPLWSVRLQ